MLKGKVVREVTDWPRHLRLIVNQGCNYNCSFPGTKCEWCHKDGAHLKSGLKRQADVDDFLFVAESLKESFGLTKFKLGAMEPTLFPGIEKLVAGAKKMNFNEVSMTSNGYLLDSKLDEIKKSGLDILTVSMHAFNREMYKSITGVDGFEKVKKTIEKAAKMGFQKVKVNRVLINFDGLWEDLMSFFEWAAEYGVRVKLYKLIWSPKMDEKMYFKSYVPWKSLLLFLKNNGEVVKINKYLVAGRERLQWRLNSGLELETDEFINKLGEGMGRVCGDCKLASVCLEGLMSYGIEINSELLMSGCLLRDDLITDLWEDVKKRDADGIRKKVGEFLDKII